MLGNSKKDGGKGILEAKQVTGKGRETTKQDAGKGTDTTKQDVLVHMHYAWLHASLLYIYVYIV